MNPAEYLVCVCRRINDPHPLRIRLGKLEVTSSNRSVERNVLRFESSFVPVWALLLIARPGSRKTDRGVDVEQDGEIRLRNLQGTGESINQFPGELTSYSLIDPGCIVKPVAKDDVTAVKSRLNYLFDVLVAIGQIEEKLRHRFS